MKKKIDYSKQQTFKAAILINQLKPLELVHLKFPSRLEKGQVLVKVKKASICGAQIGEIDGVKGKDKWLPHCLGHEGYAEVIDKNFEVKTVNIGDEVIMHWRKGDGIDSSAAKYESSIGLINAGFVTTFQEYAVVSENRITALDDITGIERIIPLLGCALPTAYGILTKESPLEKEDQILIIGAGGIGMNLGLISKILGSKKIFLIDKSNYKKKLIDEFGLHFLKASTAKEMTNVLGGKRFNKVIDTTGNNDLINKGFDFLSSNGDLIMVGQPRTGSTLKIYDPIRLFNEGLRIIVCDGGDFNPAKDMQPLIDLVRNKKLEYSRLISHEISLDQINKGIEIIRSGNAVRVLININE